MRVITFLGSCSRRFDLQAAGCTPSLDTVDSTVRPNAADTDRGTHQERLEHPLVGVRREAAGVQEPLLQHQAFGVREVEEAQYGVQRGRRCSERRRRPSLRYELIGRLID